MLLLPTFLCFQAYFSRRLLYLPDHLSICCALPPYLLHPTGLSTGLNMNLTLALLLSCSALLSSLPMSFHQTTQLLRYPPMQVL